MYDRTSAERTSADYGMGSSTSGRENPLLRKLRAYAFELAAAPPRDELAVETEIQARMAAHMREYASSLPSTPSAPPSAATIPTFFRPRPAADTLAAMVAKEARLRVLQAQHDALLDNEELERLWFLLREHATSLPEDDPPLGEDGDAPPEPPPERINYDGFCVVRDRCAEAADPAKCAGLFSAASFLRFAPDAHGRIALLPFFHYAMRKTTLLQARIYLAYHDAAGDGLLRPADLEAYVAQMMPSLPCLRGMDPTFAPQYRRIAARKFLFMLDPAGRGRVRLPELLSSPVLAELLDLRHELPAAGVDTPGAEASLSANWFSPASAHRVYLTFLELDADRSGTLSLREFSQYGAGGLTDIFCRCLFAEYLARRRGPGGAMPSTARPGEMDFGAFLDFVLAWENRRTKRSLAYFFRVLDFRHRGAIGKFEIHTFFSAVLRKWLDNGQYELSADDVKDEIFDMIKPADPLNITLADLEASQCGDTVVGILADVMAFYAYDSRETLLAQAQAAQQQQQQQQQQQ